MSFLTVTNISKKHGADFLLNDISFTQSAGQRLAIAGETGSGKTTLMRIVAGLGQADSGMVMFEGKQVKGIDEKLMPGHKGIAYLSQHFELPNKYRVSELLAYANDLTDEESAELYEVCDVTHLLHRWAQTLSGGESQRVALAKLLTTKPKLLLLDEPFSNLDLAHKHQLQTVIWNLTEKLGITCMLISHEPDEILPWADEVFIMRNGAIIQRGTPQQIYQQPDSAYVAGLLGKYISPSPALAASLDLSTDKPHYLRPEQFIITGYNTLSIPAVVRRSLYLGGYYELEVTVDDVLFTIRTEYGTHKKGDTIQLRVIPSQS